MGFKGFYRIYRIFKGGGVIAFHYRITLMGVIRLMVQKSQTTTWDVNNGINYLSTGAGFQPSTVVGVIFFTNSNSNY